MKNYHTVIISYKELYATGKFKELDWVAWCWEYVGENNFSWTVDLPASQVDLNETHVNYVYIIRFEYEEDKLLFILNWV